MTESKSSDMRENDQLSLEKFELEKLRAQQDYELRQKEIELKGRELLVKESEAKEGKWRSPLTLAIAAALLGGFTSITVTYLQNSTSQEMARSKAQADLIIESTRTADPAIGKKNLLFFIKAKLIDDPDNRLTNLITNDVYPSFETRMESTFPQNIASLTHLAAAAIHKLEIVTDVCTYGHFSVPAESIMYLNTLKEAAHRNVVVDMYIYDDQTSERMMRMQIRCASWLVFSSRVM